MLYLKTRQIAIFRGLRSIILGTAAHIKADSWVNKYKKFEMRVGDVAKQMNGQLCIRTVQPGSVNEVSAPL